jgi:hypothetical protein
MPSNEPTEAVSNGADQIINLAKVPKTGLIVKVDVAQGYNRIQRAISTKRAVYIGSVGQVTRVITLEKGISLVVPERVEALVIAVSGAPVTVDWDYPVLGEVTDPDTGEVTLEEVGLETASIVINKLFIIDQPLPNGFTVTASGSTQVDLNYQA